MIINKKGFSLVEIMVSVALLAVISAGLATTVIMSRTFINSAYAIEENSAKAQKIADALMLEIPKNPSLQQIEVDAENNAHYKIWEDVDKYDNVNKYSYQFSYEVADEISPSIGIIGYVIKVVVFYDDGKSHVVVNAYTDKSWSS